MARVQLLRENTVDPVDPAAWRSWLPWYRYLYDDGGMQTGYRFIWWRPETEGGSLQAARGQARSPSIAVMERLIEKARQDGWGDHTDAEDRK
jgi:hypothetical protein